MDIFFVATKRLGTGIQTKKGLKALVNIIIKRNQYALISLPSIKFKKALFTTRFPPGVG